MHSYTLLEQALHVARFVAVEVRMLNNSRKFVLVFQLWATISTCVRAQMLQLLEPPYAISAGVRTEDSIPFSCATINGFGLEEWALYRNGVRQNTTDACIFPGKISDNGVLTITISSACDGVYSCGAEYNNTDDKAGLVLSDALPVYGEWVCVCYSVISVTKKAKLERFV